MARNARIHGVLIYLWIHSTLLFVRFLTESISFKAKKKHQSVINFLSIPVFILMLRILYTLRIQRFFANISTIFNRDIERDTVSVIMIQILRLLIDILKLP